MQHSSPTKEKRFHVLPTTPFGRQALLFFAISLVAWAVTPLAAVDALRWVIWVFGWAGLGALLASGVLAVMAIMRDRERAISVYVVVFMVLWFLVAVVAILLSGGE